MVARIYGPKLTSSALKLISAFWKVKCWLFFSQPRSTYVSNWALFFATKLSSDFGKNANLQNISGDTKR